MITPILETERLVLRPVTIEDAPAIQKYFNNWNIIQNLSKRVPWPYPDDGAETFIKEQCLAQMESGEAMIWAVTRKGDDECIGVLDYQVTGDDYGNRGFWLGEHLWGQGYMTEAVTAFQDHLFFDLGVPSIIVCNIKTNVGSRRVKEKTGAEFLGDVHIDHHSGDGLTEKWRITREGWAGFRGVPLADLPDIQGTPVATDHPHPRFHKP